MCDIKKKKKIEKNLLRSEMNSITTCIDIICSSIQEKADWDFPIAKVGIKNNVASGYYLSESEAITLIKSLEVLTTLQYHLNPTLDL